MYFERAIYHWMVRVCKWKGLGQNDWQSMGVSSNGIRTPFWYLEGNTTLKNTFYGSFRRTWATP